MGVAKKVKHEAKLAKGKTNKGAGKVSKGKKRECREALTMPAG